MKAGDKMDIPMHRTYTQRALRLARCASIALMLAGLAHAASVSAAACAGFDDVDSASAFCPSVEWIRNRNVTLGCTVNQYCPNDYVNRLQMAAFLSRLGSALTPIVLSSDLSLDATDIVPGAVVCMSGNGFAFAHPARATLDVVISAMATTDSSIALTLLTSTDGQSWTAVSPDPVLSDLSANRWLAIEDVGSYDISPGSSPIFAIGISREGAAGASSLQGLRCKLRVRIVGETGTQSPY